ncbi:EndoS/ChiA family endoglycosidase [Dyella sp.]|uniref:EndoS/ChiA family endoglycosidase n=1 Tax=Dyella sp. TaxID=1869338 RepID=UPI002ED43A9A
MTLSAGLACLLFTSSGQIQAASSSACPADNSHATGAALEEILDYKRGDHQIMAAYFRSWRDIASNPATNKTSMDDLPDCLDIAFVFPEGSEGEAFWPALKNHYVPVLRSRGTKVVRTVGIEVFLEDDYENSQAGYDFKAAQVLERFMTPYDLDGLDVDVESALSSEQVQRVSGVFRSLSKSIGPKSGTGKLFIYDTNQAGSHPLFTSVNDLIDYVLVQSYGRSVSGLQATFDSYKPFISPGQYLIGFSFYEERGPRWGDVSTPLEGSRAYQYANWQPTGSIKGGIFSYAVDRDGVTEGTDAIVTTDYGVTRQLISTMNP